MKAAVFINVPIAFDGCRYRGIYTNLINAFGKLARYFDELTLLLPVARQPKQQWSEELALNWSKTRIIELPYFVGDDIRSRDGLLKLPIVLPLALFRIARVVKECDVIGAAVPSILGNFTSALAIGLKKPVFHFVRGDKEKTLSAIYRMEPEHTFFKNISHILESFVKWGVSCGIPTFVVGVGLFKKYEPKLRQGSLLCVAAPVLTEDFVPSPNRWNRIPDRSNVRLLFVGRLSPEKGVEVLIQALAILRDKHAMQPEVAILGDGPERSRLEWLAKTLKLSKVKFLGFVSHGPQLVKFYQNADALIVPSIAEGLGAVIAEAMATGAPVIASDVGGIPTIAKHGVNSLLVPPGSPEALAKAIVDLIDSPRMWLRFSREAIQTASLYRDDYQIQEMIKIVSAHYRFKLPSLG